MNYEFIRVKNSLQGKIVCSAHKLLQAWKRSIDHYRTTL